MPTLSDQDSGAVPRFIDGKPVYRLGRISFTVETTLAAFEDTLCKLLHPCVLENEKTFSFSCNDFRSLLSAVLELQKEYLWISAACLRSPEGKKILLAGPSSAGKSTTAMALALCHGWKILSEDLTGIDTENNRIFSFATPFSVKAGTSELLQQAFSICLQDLVSQEWLELSSSHLETELEAEFDLALFFYSSAKSAPLNTTRSTAARYVRLLLPLSNMLHESSRPDKLANYLASASCYELTGGTLAERVSFLLGASASACS